MHAQIQVHEDPQRLQDEAWNFQLAQPRVPPGSAEEEDALLALDAARAAEERELTDTPQARRARHERHWRRKLR